MVYYQVAFPYSTGVILFIAAAYVYYVYTKTANRALLIFSLGLVFVGMESVLDGVVQSRLLALAGGDWDKLPQLHPGSVKFMLALDAVRGIFIILWAMMEVMFTAELAGASKTYKVYVPIAILIIGVAETFALNFSHIEPLGKRILISSAGRVIFILIPVALVAGFYILLKLWMPLRSPSLLYFALGFIIHGFTLPLYSTAKEHGALTLGLWYLFGGVVPSLLAAVGSYYLLEEFKKAAMPSTGE
jgi:hypothetical protein